MLCIVTFVLEVKNKLVTLTQNLFQGIMHTSKPVFTAQFHPEAFGGPTDTEVWKIVFYKTSEFSLLLAVGVFQNVMRSVMHNMSMNDSLSIMNDTLCFGLFHEISGSAVRNGKRSRKLIVRPTFCFEWKFAFMKPVTYPTFF